MPTPHFDNDDPYSNPDIRHQLEAENEAKFRSLEPYSDPAIVAMLKKADSFDNLFGSEFRTQQLEA